jgi:hypothetical protein
VSALSGQCPYDAVNRYGKRVAATGTPLTVSRTVALRAVQTESPPFPAGGHESGMCITKASYARRLASRLSPHGSPFAPRKGNATPNSIGLGRAGLSLASPSKIGLK